MVSLQLGASGVDTIGHVLGNKPEANVKPDVKQKNQSKVTSEKTSKDESSSVKRKQVEAFELPGIQTETPPKVKMMDLLLYTYRET